MAGLLESIAKQLLGIGNSKNTYTVSPVKKAVEKTTSSTMVKVKPAETNKANDWVKNSTIENPVKIVIKEKVTEEKSGVEEKAEVAEASIITAIDRTVKRERTQTEVEKEDYLLTQIDEFREKAQHLQDLLLSKESKVMELQTIVDEREIKAKELEHILDERQRKADGITAEVAKQIDNLIEKVSAKMEEIGDTIGKDLENGQKLSDEQIEELKETLASITTQLDTIKGELSEKVHSENVKCYRNVADLFKSVDEKVDAIKGENSVIEQKVKSVQKCTIAIIVLSVINMLGLAALIVLQFLG